MKPTQSSSRNCGSHISSNWVNEFFGLKGDDRLSVMKVVKVARWVSDQYEKHDRMTTISDQELEAQVKELMPKYWEKYKG